MLTVSDNHIVLGGGGGGGGGDVVGATSSTDNAIARFDGTTGKLVQNSSVTISDTGDIAINGVTTVQPTLINGVSGTVSVGSNNTTNSGGFNVSIGTNSLYSNSSGEGSLAIGQGAMFYNTSGNYNVGVGTNSLFHNTSGYSNVAIGQSSIYYANAINSTSIGFSAGTGSSSGNLTSVNGGVFVGAHSKSLSPTSVNEVVIGANAVGNGNNTVTLGDSAITGTYLRNIRVIGQLYDNVGSSGTDGQVLKKVGGLVIWANP